MGLSLDQDQDQDDHSEEKIRVEFAVNIKNEDELKKIKNCLLDKKGVKFLFYDAQSNSIQLELDHEPVNVVGSGNANYKDELFLGNVQQAQNYIEKETGILTVVNGLGSLKSAVAELRPSEDNFGQKHKVLGIMRLSQLSNNLCFFDGSIDGTALSSNLSIAIHEYGNLDGTSFKFIGDPILEIAKLNTTPTDSSISIRKIIPDCDVIQMIGRSVAVSSLNDNQNVILSAGVIAGAATVQANKKQICSCSGKTIWQERSERQLIDDTN